MIKNLKQELKKRSISNKEFRAAINYTQQGIDKAIGTELKPKPCSAVLELAFEGFLARKAGINVRCL